MKLGIYNIIRTLSSSGIIYNFEWIILDENYKFCKIYLTNKP